LYGQYLDKEVPVCGDRDRNCQEASYQEALSKIVSEIVAPAAAEVDRTGFFPKDGVSALASAGILATTVPEEFGGGGLGLSAATDIVRQLANACGSTAMIVTMHYAATAVLVATGNADVLREIGAGEHLTTLAFSEAGSRSYFWAPVGTAVADGDDVLLNARKSWVTSAGEATSYVWSSKPREAGGPMTLWLVRSDAGGLSRPSGFDGVGLRGNDSTPVTAEQVRIPLGAMLGQDGAGLDIALTAALPWFLLLNASAGVGLMQSVTAETVKHLTSTKLEHLGQTLAQQLPVRAKLATMQIQTDRTGRSSRMRYRRSRAGGRTHSCSFSRSRRQPTRARRSSLTWPWSRVAAQRSARNSASNGACAIPGPHV
jgi:isovaleryl-CoA dehydrogenase